MDKPLIGKLAVGALSLALMLNLQPAVATAQDHGHGGGHYSGGHYSGGHTGGYGGHDYRGTAAGMGRACVRMGRVMAGAAMADTPITADTAITAAMAARAICGAACPSTSMAAIITATATGCANAPT